MRTLFVVGFNPYDSKHGTSTRFKNLIHKLKDTGSLVDILYIHSSPSDVLHEDVNSFYWVDYNTYPDRFYWETDLNKDTLQDFTWPELSMKFKYLINENRYSRVILGSVLFANLLDEITTMSLETVLALEDCMSMNIFEKNYPNNYPQVFTTCFIEEIKRLNKFKVIWTVSLDDLLFLQKFTRKHIVWKYLPHEMEDKSHLTTEYKYDIVYVASNNVFNIVSLQWFFNEVYQYLSNYRILLVGKSSYYITCEYLINHSKTQIVREVENLDDIYAKSKVVIAPILLGTGVKIKILEAIQYGKPVVTTLQGLVGQVNKTNNGIIATNNPRVFAQEVTKLIEDFEYYDKIKKQVIEYGKMLHNL